MLVSLLVGVVIFYLLLTLVLTYLVHRLPRRPVKNEPDWGRVTDTTVAAKDGGSLEVWRIEPDGHSRGTVILAHGWSRNRDRMVERAKIFGRMGFTTVIHSARDHGNSSPYKFMNALRFAEDIEAVMGWVKEPVLLYGHSIGAAGATIIAHKNPERIRLLFLEGCYAKTREALLHLYYNYNPLFGILFAPLIIFWMEIFYGWKLDVVSPMKLAPTIDLPVLLIHGENDRNFPLHHLKRLSKSFPPGRAETFIAKGADHSSSSLASDYPSAVQAFVGRYLPLKGKI